LVHSNATAAQEQYTHYANQTRKKVTIKKDDILLNTKELDFTQYTSRIKSYLLDSLAPSKSYGWLTLLPLSFAFQAISNFTESSTPPNFTPANHLPELSLHLPTSFQNLLPRQSKPLLAKGLTLVPTNTECYGKATKTNIGFPANTLSKLTSSFSNLKTTHFGLSCKSQDIPVLSHNLPKCLKTYVLLGGGWCNDHSLAFSSPPIYLTLQ
jgi:hypothetical protein